VSARQRECLNGQAYSDAIHFCQRTGESYAMLTTLVRRADDDLAACVIRDAELERLAAP